MRVRLLLDAHLTPGTPEWDRLLSYIEDQRAVMIDPGGEEPGIHARIVGAQQVGGTE
jgi:hypothetical protein